MHETYVLEWSKAQNCLHVQPAARLAETNLVAFMKNRGLNDYHVLIVGSREECERCAERLRHRLIEREQVNAPDVFSFAN